MRYTVQQSRDAIGEYLLIVQELMNDIQQDEAKILAGLSGVTKRSVREEFSNAKLGLKEAVRALKSADRWTRR